MYFKIIRNEIIRNKALVLMTMIFVTAASVLISLAAMLTVHLSGALDTLMTTAKTPHFMQMHSGDLDKERLTAFAKEQHHVDQFQVVEFLNVDRALIQLGDESLAASVQDNGFTVQSEKFDYLLDLEGRVIEAGAGELYVPITYMKEGRLNVGDRALVNGKEFTVAGFLRDSQMNSTLSSSKRFLVSPADYEAIKPFGSVEYLIEFRLKDLSQLGAFEAAYSTAGLEANGPALTYSLFKLLNVISDGMMIAVILLISMLVVAIALLCIRFVLLAKIEEDYREIGVLKAIGLRLSDSKKIYMANYAVLAAAGCLLGFALSFLFKNRLLENIQLYMGDSGNSSSALLLGIGGILLVFVSILVFVSSVLRRFRHISAAQAIRFGVSQEQGAKSGRYLRLNENRLLHVNLFLGVRDVLSRKRLYATMLVVLVLAVFMMIVPQNLYSTISASSFIQYMGVGQYEMRIDIQQAGLHSGKANELIREIGRDDEIAKYAVLTTKTFQRKTEDGTFENMRIELGDHSVFPIEYADGRAPVTEDEIALSTLNADEIGKKVGDVITVIVEGREEELTVSGIYSDITNGGKTAKAVFTDQSAPAMWTIVCAELTDQAFITRKVAEYEERFTFAKVSNIEAFIAGTFGATISSVKQAANAAVFISLIITALVTLLFVKLLVAKDRYAIAVMKALGFTSADIAMQYVARSLFVLAVGIVLGTLLASTLGERLAGALISSFGAVAFQFSTDPLSAYVLSPLMLASVVLIATVMGTAGVSRIKISESIKE